MNVGDYAEKYAKELIAAMINEGIDVAVQQRQFIYEMLRQAYSRGFRDAQSLEWLKSIKGEGNEG